MEQDEHIPALVEDWTWDTIVHVVKKHEFEPSLYDFKVVLHPTGDQAHRDRHIILSAGQPAQWQTQTEVLSSSGCKIERNLFQRQKNRIKGISVQVIYGKNLARKLCHFSQMYILMLCLFACLMRQQMEYLLCISLRAHGVPIWCHRQASIIAGEKVVML